MYEVLAKHDLAQQIKLIKVQAPDIARKARPGQFAIIRTDEKGERIPLTLVDWDKEKGTITLIFQEIGVSTRKLGNLKVGNAILNVVGPLGIPSNVTRDNLVCIVGGGVGIAPAYPIARAFKEGGTRVISIIGAKTEALLILEAEMRSVSDELYVATDDGSKGSKGFVSDVLKRVLNKGYCFNRVYAVGPSLMMRAVSEVTRPYGIKTIVSLNSIMVDGMGMCGACRVTVGGENKFACVDGPEFDGHQVRFDELINRQRMYLTDEELAMQLHKNIGGHHRDRCKA